MSDLLPWLAVAGLGALHGLNPATGWLAATARGVRARDSTQMLRALRPIAAGHVASVAMVAATVALGLVMDHAKLRWIAGALFLAMALHYLCRRAGRPPHKPDRQIGLLLWSFMMATAHGAGLMLIPALIPLCLSDTPAREITASGSLAMALAAVGLHTIAMLAVTAAIGTLGCRHICGHRFR